jgi:hypothetical protein
MPKARILFHKFILSLAALLLIIGYPLSAAADPAPTDDGSTASAASPPPGPNYWFDPVTRHWNSDRWIWDAAQGKYVRNTPPPAAPAADVTVPTADTSPVPSDGTSGAQSDNNSSAALGVNNSAGVDNNIKADAVTGNAKVSGNTLAGSAASGNASDMATLINSLQSSTSLQGGGLTTFSTDIYGNVQGDIMIDPSQLTNLTGVNTGTVPNNTTINVKDSGQINNDLTLNAKTGDAAVTSNTKAGDAATGNASAVGNIVNVINSVIGSGQSFIGSVNIYGNLDGDILMPPDVLNSLLASNAAPTVTTTTSTNDKTLTANLSEETSLYIIVGI